MGTTTIETYENLVAVYDIMGFRTHCDNEGDENAINMLLHCFDKIDYYYSLITKDYKKNLILSFYNELLRYAKDENDSLFIELNVKFKQLLDTRYIKCELQADNIVIWINEKDKNYCIIREYFKKLYKEANLTKENMALIDNSFNGLVITNFLFHNIAVNLSFLIENGWFLRGAINYGWIIKNENPHLIGGNAFLEAHTLGEKQDSFTTFLMPKAVEQLKKYPDLEFIVKIYFPYIQLRFKNLQVPILCSTMNLFQGFLEIPDKDMNSKPMKFQKIIDNASDKIILRHEAKQYSTTNIIIERLNDLTAEEVKWINTFNVMYSCIEFKLFHYYFNLAEEYNKKQMKK